MRRVLIFVGFNSLLIIVVLVFLILPMTREINHLRSHITWQESQYSARTRHYMDYEDNLRQLDILNEERRLLTYDEVVMVISNIKQVMEANSLQSLNFSTNEQTSFYTSTLGQVTEHRISTEHEVEDVLGFLYALETTPANILTTGIVWGDNQMARISVDMLLLSAGN